MPSAASKRGRPSRRIKWPAETFTIEQLMSLNGFSETAARYRIKTGIKSKAIEFAGIVPIVENGRPPTLYRKTPKEEKLT